MQAPRSRILTIALAAVLALGTMDAALARHKKHRAKPPVTPSITRDYDGTPIIMRGPDAPRPRIMREEEPPKQGVERPRVIPRGSSTYIPPPVPSPYANPPPPLTQPPAVYQPPPIRSFGDRVIDAIHAYPLEKGIGNNPTDQQMFIRQRANQ